MKQVGRQKYFQLCTTIKCKAMQWGRQQAKRSTDNIWIFQFPAHPHLSLLSKRLHQTHGTRLVSPSSCSGVTRTTKVVLPLLPAATDWRGWRNRGCHWSRLHITSTITHQLPTGSTHVYLLVTPGHHRLGTGGPHYPLATSQYQACTKQPVMTLSTPRC